MQKAIVIGSGIGGIAIALRLAHRGYAVTVFEKESAAGGKITSYTNSGFRFDMGPSLFTLPKLVDELFALFNRQFSDYCEVVELPVTCNYYFPDGTQLKAWSNKERFIDEIKALGYPAGMLEKYLHRQSFLYENTSEFFLFNSIHKLSTYIGDAGRKSLKALHRLDALTSMHNRNQKTFGKSNLTQLFDRYATYNGSDPYRAPATLNMIAHLEHNTGAFFPKKGMHEVVLSLVKLAKEVGIEFKLNEPVLELIPGKKNINSVITSKGNYLCDLVVNDTDVTYFYKHLLKQKLMLKKLAKRERSSSALIFYWGVNFTSELHLHNILFSSDYKEEFKGLFGTKQLADDLTVYIFISKKVVETDAPKGKENWFVMVNAPENVGQNWDELTRRVRATALAKIKMMLKIDIEPLIEKERILTPVDIETRTASVGGSLYGHSSNSAMAAFLRHPNFSKEYKNLYFVGGSVHPGGGIPLCLASAKIVDQLIKTQ
jgi:phytoene desaturase